MDGCNLGNAFKYLDGVIMISDQQAEEALNYLSETDEQFAHAKQQVEARERYVELLKAQAFLDASGNIEERKAQARISDDVKKAQREYLKALEEYETIRAKRDTSQTTIWTWKAIKASERTV